MADPKRRGRPRLDPHDESVPLALTLPAKKFDALWTEARRQGVTMPEHVRRLLYGTADPIPPNKLPKK
jgi:hypothetical protein